MRFKFVRLTECISAFFPGQFFVKFYCRDLWENIALISEFCESGSKISDSFLLIISTVNIIGVIKSRRNRWPVQVARMGEKNGAYRILVRRREWRGPVGRPRRRWDVNIKMDRQEVGCGAWTGLSWLRIGTGCGFLWMWQLTSGFNKMLGISELAEKPLGSEKGRCSLEYVS
jgi:hypothetical protein